MNVIQQFAADLKARKNPRTRTARNDQPAQAPPCASRRVAVSTLERLKAELRSAKERACKAEAALAAVKKIEAMNGKIWRLNQEIARLRRRAAGRWQPARRLKARIAACNAATWRKLLAAWKRIEALEAEIEQLRPEAKRREDWQVTRQSLQALLHNHPKSGVISIRAAAAAVGVNAKAVDNWLRGICRPRPETQELIAAWVKTRTTETRPGPDGHDDNQPKGNGK